MIFLDPDTNPLEELAKQALSRPPQFMDKKDVVLVDERAFEEGLQRNPFSVMWKGNPFLEFVNLRDAINEEWPW